MPGDCVLVRPSGASPRARLAPRVVASWPASPGPEFRYSGVETCTDPTTDTRTPPSSQQSSVNHRLRYFLTD
jgi:hypothetical protein